MATIPVFVLTGFLGSGKTTLLNKLFKKYPQSALLINELGDIGIDDQLVKHNGMPVYLMAGGCICCTVQHELLLTLRNLFIARDAGDLPPFERLIIETTGAADPSSVLELLEQDRFLARNCHLGAVITTIDAEAGEEQLQNYPEVIDQVLAADILLITKCDRASESAKDSLEQALEEINPHVQPVRVFYAEHPADLLQPTLRQHRCRITGIYETNVYKKITLVQPAPPHALLMTPKGLANHLRTSKALAHAGFHAASLRFNQANSINEIMDALAVVFQRCGEHLVRFKGIFAIEGISSPYLVQWAAPRLELPELLSAWPSADHSTRMVLIVHHEAESFAGERLNEINKILFKNKNVFIDGSAAAVSKSTI